MGSVLGDHRISKTDLIFDSGKYLFYRLHCVASKIVQSNLH